MNRLFPFIILLFIIHNVVFSGAPQGKVGTKSLPLDGIPNVVLKSRTNSHYLPDRVIVKLMPKASSSLSKSSFGIPSIDRILSKVSVSSVSRMFPTPKAAAKSDEVDLSLFFVVQFSSPNDPFTLAGELSKNQEIQYAEPWFIYPLAKTSFVPNDPSYGLQWGLQKIDASSAWDVSKGDSTVVIAIVDSGVEWAHPDLSANIWSNPGETGTDPSNQDKRSNGVDDDGNGYVDDWHGWDLVGADYQDIQADNNPTPTGSNNDHGTHVAGIAGAVTNNSVGIASLGFRCKILPVKCSADNDNRGTGGVAYILGGYSGITYAAQMGAKVINCSWGGPGGSQFEQDIINFATQHGSLVVAAMGNDASDIFFSPAGYNGVLAVAATNQNDVRASFSNYGSIVDVCAPGTGIYSTLYRSTYATWDGTSMAAPFATALAGLVKSAFPNFTPLQVGEQVRVTCDNIDAANPNFIGLLGRGRINALKALTVTNLPSVRLQSFAVSDVPGGNGNNVAQPAETLNVRCMFRNYLAPTSANARVELTSLSPFVTVINGTFAVSSLGTLDSVSNAASLFRVYVQTGVPQSHTAVMRLQFTDGSFTDGQQISFLVNPTYQTHNINAIQATLTNNGRVGFFDFPDNKEGVGFIYNNANHLYEGGLIIGASSTQVVDVVRNDQGSDQQNQDFFSNNFYTMTTPGVVSHQDGFTTFTDINASSTNRLGIQVDMYSYAFSNPLDSKYIVLRYTIRNTGSLPLDNMYAGIFLDWDLGDFSKDMSAFDVTRSLGYCNDASATRTEYVGIRALDSAASFRSLVNDATINLSRSAKWDWLSGGFGAAQAGPADIHHVISSGPYTIQPGSAQTVGFALVAADSSLANLQIVADAAKAKWKIIRNTVGIEHEGNEIPTSFSLSQNYPNPFNPSTNFEFRVASSEFVSIKVFDMLGREVTILVNEERKPGVYKVVWDASALPSGVYLYRIQAGSFKETRKMILMR